MKNQPNIRITNSASWKSKDRWDWSVWVEGEETELDQISSVKYTLHPTFRDPHREVSDRETKFCLSSNGWGEFLISAKIHLINGNIIPMNHWLRLTEGGKSSNSPSQPTKQKSKKIFLSYSNADIHIAAQLSKFLSDKNFTIISGDSINVGDSITRSIQTALGHSDAHLVVLSDDPSKWVLEEIRESLKQCIDIILISIGDDIKIPSSLKQVSTIYLKKELKKMDLEEIEIMIQKRIKL